MDPKHIEHFAVYLQSIVHRQFPHDEVNVRIENGKVKAKMRARSSDRDAICHRLGEIEGFVRGLMKAPCLFSKSDIQCAVYLATPDKPAPKLPD